MQEVSCGKVTIEERDEIKKLHYRKMALIEVFQALAKADVSKIDSLYEKAIIDLGETSAKYSGWWDKISEKYEWNRDKEFSNWKVNFDTGEVFLTRSEQ